MEMVLSIKIVLCSNNWIEILLLPCRFCSTGLSVSLHVQLWIAMGFDVNFAQVLIRFTWLRGCTTKVASASLATVPHFSRILQRLCPMEEDHFWWRLSPVHQHMKVYFGKVLVNGSE